MRFTSLPRYYRNLKRWREIILVLRKYGLADWLSRLPLDFIRDWIKDDHGVPLASYSHEARVRMALTDLGPTFIKLGQVLSLRPDLVGSELATELRSLQSNVPGDPADAVRSVVETELRKPIEELFGTFEFTPLASASIGQAHAATLLDGTQVIVKVQHAHIRKTIAEDLEVIGGLASLAQGIRDLAVWQPKSIVDQLARQLKRELSFSQEEANLVTLSQALGDIQGLVIPKPFVSHCSPRVLTMERIEGKSINDVGDTSFFPDLDRDALAHKVSEIYVAMIFAHGHYHADPHPGNILVQPDGTVGLLDFGMVGRIDEKLRADIEEMLWAVAVKDSALLTSLVKRVGKAPSDIDETALAEDVSDLIAIYGNQPIDRIDLAGALNDATDILHRHRVILPSQLGVLIKTLVTLQGTISQTSPQFSLLQVIEPMFRKLWWNRYSPRRQARRLRRMVVEVEGLVEKLPSQISSLMEIVQAGKLDVHLSHRGLSPSINRLVLGLLTSSLLLGSSVLMAYDVPPLLFMDGGPFGLKDLSLIGFLGFMFSFLVAFRIMLAINKSGHLDTQSDESEFHS
ncbi:MAG: AarF/ABC1/UbiB kinase family protein [Planctomycetes bacterium]|jgi:ubiquinone biosynthesis protein|nr:AarF/ABC1/UbiB kinase family protein [Planctomycetota bacterium]